MRKIEFQVTIQFCPNDLRILVDAEYRLFFAKSEKPNVVWSLTDLCFSNNVIKWEENYGLYAATGPELKTGQVINTNNMIVSAKDGIVYNFSKNGNLNPSTAICPEGTYQITNLSNNGVNLGFLQSGSINGKNFNNRPINTQYILPNTTLSLKPSTKLYIWLSVYCKYQSGMVIDTIPYVGTSIELNSEKPYKTIQFNLCSEKFEPVD